MDLSFPRSHRSISTSICCRGRHLHTCRQPLCSLSACTPARTLETVPFTLPGAGSPCNLCFGSWQRPCMPGSVPGDIGIKVSRRMAANRFESNSFPWSGLAWLSSNKIPSPQDKIWLATCSCLCTTNVELKPVQLFHFASGVV